jgi:hypothetical protein
MTGSARRPFGLEQVFFLTFFLALVSRLIMITAGPLVQGDSFSYLAVAENLLHNGCVSLSPPTIGACVPHWGGNQLPGYPLFISAIWFVTGESLMALLIAQSVVYAAAAGFAANAMRAILPRYWMPVPLGAVLALAPSTMGFSRVVLTEELAAALALFVFGLLIRSYAIGRFPTFAIGVVSAFAFFVRYDLALLAMPIAICAVRVSGVRRAAIQGVAVVMIVTTPVALWSVRNVVHGLGPWPPFGIGADGQPIARGPLDWMETWVTSQRSLATSVWPFAAGDYAAIKTPWDRTEAVPEIADALSELRSLPPQSPIPVGLDARFAQLAALARQDKIHQWITNPSKRLADLWLNPQPSLGWPGDLSESDRSLIRQILAEHGVAMGGVRVLAVYPVATVSKIWVNGWRFLTLVGGLSMLVAVFLVTRLRPYRFFVLLAFSFIAARSVAFAATILVETRYLMPALPWLDVVAMIGVLFVFSNSLFDRPWRSEKTERGDIQ